MKAVLGLALFCICGSKALGIDLLRLAQDPVKDALKLVECVGLAEDVLETVLPVIGQNRIAGISA